MQYRHWMMIVVFFLTSCGGGEEGVYSPKPRMYPKVDLPLPEYELMEDRSDCGFEFRKSTHAQVIERTTFFEEELDYNCWFDLYYPGLEAQIHFTYYPITNDQTYQNLANESFRMAYEHSAVASGIHESPIGQEEGMIFTLTGPVASPYQFYLSDNSNHFLRGALYFNSRPQPDSLAPILDYIKTDIDTLIKSFSWK